MAIGEKLGWDEKRTGREVDALEGQGFVVVKRAGPTIFNVALTHRGVQCVEEEPSLLRRAVPGGTSPIISPISEVGGAVTVAQTIEPLLAQEFYLKQGELEDALARLQSDLSLRGLARSGANIELTQKEYERDIAARKDAFVVVVKKCLPAFGGVARDALLKELQEFARQHFGAYISAVEKKLQGHAAGLSLSQADRLTLGGGRVLQALDAELAIVVRGQQRAELEHSAAAFVDAARLDQLRSMKSSTYDLSRLVRLCEEADFCYKSGCFHAVAMLTRAILDHVPPIFGCATFGEVANQYGGGKSFREIASQLEKSARKIADAHLHGSVRPKETLPTRTQVNASQNLDVVLAEVVRILS